MPIQVAAAGTPRSRGLTSAEALHALREHGPNALPAAAPEPDWHRLLRQFASPLVYVLLVALALDLGLWLARGAPGWPVESLVIAAILLLNAVLGVVQERRSERALEGLASLAAPRAWVLRDGRLAQVPAAELVPGDVVRLEAGERVPADARLDQAMGLLLDESILTGESVPVDRAAGDEVLSGTLVVRGVAWAQIGRTGAASAMGRLARLVGGLGPGSTPLERRLQAFGRRVSLAVLLLAAAMVLAGTLTGGLEHAPDVLVFSVALAVSVVPEGLPAVVTLTLALGVQRMARRAAVVRRLAAVEALGSVTVIATDKTGTLTENRLVVRGLEADDPEAALRAAVLANDAEGLAGAGDPLDQALLEHARSQGLDVAGLRTGRPRLSQRPFDSAWSFARSTVRGPGGPESWLKGAPEVLLARCTLAAAERERWSRRTLELARDGARVLGLAHGEGETEADLRFLGLVALWDAPRPEVAGALAAARRAGVRVVMITGDHPATALAVARAVGLDPPGARPVLTGAELGGLDPGALRAAVRDTSVFARTSPEHKLALVEALRAEGHVVAVTGDGVNDAPALKRADVGVAMGRRGSDVAREVADLVLLDDNFATIVGAIEEGRGLFANIRSFLRFLIATNAAEALLVTAGVAGAWLLGLRDAAGALLLPLSAVQILWINLVTDGPPALALGLDRREGLLHRAPLPPRAPLLDRPSMVFVAGAGLLVAALAGVLLALLPHVGEGPVATRTVTFLYITLAQLLLAYPARTLDGPTRRNRSLDASVAGVAILQLALLALPAGRAAFGLAGPGAGGWLGLALALGATQAGVRLLARRIRG